MTVALLAITLAVSWPLATQMGRSLPGDYGDPLFVTWAMGWVSGRLADGAWRGFWDANIFFPEADTLAFSEHFIAQSVMVWPVWWATGNLILAYNVAFVLTFVLTGLGTFVLVRALTGSAAGAALAALVAAFNEYRLVHSLAHLHTLSIHWLPFALYSLHRYFETDRRRHLTAAAGFLVALGLSSVYYMAYCAPFVVLFAVAEVLRTRRARQPRVWFELWAAAAAVVVLLLPVLLPYAAVQARLGVERSLGEITQYSAALDDYPAALKGMGPILALAVVGAIAAWWDRSRRWVAATGVVLVLLAFWLSLGPVVRYAGESVDPPGLYRVLYEFVPGFRGLRVPARFATLFFLFLGLLAACGVAAVARRSPRAGRAVAAVAAAALLWQVTPTTFPLDGVLPSEGLVTPPPAYLTPAPPAVPPIYQAVETLRPGAVLAELPLGDPWYDLRYMYFAATHRRPLLNGYSGIFPPTFLARRDVLRQPLVDPLQAARALAGATHVIVHRGAWADDTGRRVGAWLETLGAQLLADVGGAALYELPVREHFASAGR